MTEMNNTVKAIIASKVARAMIDEKLKHNDVVRLLGLNSKYYSSMVTSGKPVQWDKVGKSTWKILKGWTNSGEKIMEYSKKHNLEVKKPAVVHSPEVDNTTTPPKQNPAPQEESHEDYIERAINETIDVAKSFGVTKKQLTAALTFKEGEAQSIMGTVTVKEASDAMSKVMEKVNESNSLESISKLVTAWEKDLERADILLTRTERMRKDPDEVDRLGVLLEVINELKEMGFDVDIHISPKQ